MDNKYLWSIIDVLREELSSGTEYGKLQAEIKSLEKLIDAKHKKRNEDSNLIAELKLAIVDQNDDIKTLKSNQDKLKLVIENQEDEIKELKAENCGLINESKWDKNKLIKELQAENDSLKDEAVKWNRKYNKLADNKLLSCDDDCQDTINYCNKLKAENKELKQCSNVAFVEVLNRSNDKLKAENKELKADLINSLKSR